MVAGAIHRAVLFVLLHATCAGRARAAEPTAPGHDASQCAAILRAFQRDDVMHVSRCPTESWLATIAARSARGCAVEHARVLVVGGNKGYDCAGWTRMFSAAEPAAALSAKSWRAALGAVNARMLDRGMHACGKCMQCGEDYPLPPAGAPLSRVQPPRVECVEALPVNAAMLQGARAADHWRGSGLRILHAAMTRLRPGETNVTVTFPAVDATLAGIEHVHQLKRKKGATVQVRAMTVDQLVFGSGGGGGARVPVAGDSESVAAAVQLPTVLTVDTEGSDALVLQGANRTLGTGQVALVQFEYHRIGRWQYRKLSASIALLDQHGYDCYWAGARRTYRITRCWAKEYEFHMWSNVVCAHRRHTCWLGALEEAHAPLP